MTRQHPAHASLPHPRWTLASLTVLTVVAGVLLATSSSAASVGAESIEAPSRGIVAERSFESAALGRTMPYVLYLPPGYERDETTRYPVLYMLHGLGGTHLTEWLAYGLLERADALIQAGTIQPLIIALPEGEASYWVDHADGGPAWGAYTARDVVAEIDAVARTIQSPCARAIGGNSMGAHGAMQLALNYPRVFGVVGAHSPTLRTREASLAYFGDEAHFSAHDPRSLMATRWAAAQGLHWFIDIGEDDPWLPATTALHEEMLRMRIPHEFEVRPGPHDNPYWISQLDQYLVRYDSALRATRAGC